MAGASMGNTRGDSGGVSELAPGVWGPTMVGGRRLRWKRVLAIVAIVSVVFAAAAVGVLYSLVRVAEGNIDRVDIPGLAQATTRDGVLNVLVVGSDSRAGLSEEDIDKYELGSFSGERGDTVILVSILPNEEMASLVSFPRDLLVIDDGERKKLTDTFADGPGNVVDVLQENTGIAIHHYVEVSIPGFISVVEAVGGVRMCLEEGLVDEKSGADFEAGCRHFDPTESLAYVRSRATARGDFDRIDRQQQFMKALLERIVATDILVNVPRLFNVVERVSNSLTTDEALSISDMRRLAVELRGVARGDIPMVTVPSYTASISGGSYVVPYEPGAHALYRRIDDGEPLGDWGTRSEHAETRVAVWSNGHDDEADLIRRTLFWSSFNVYRAGSGPLEIEVSQNTVFATAGNDEQASWVAETIGGEVVPVPEGVELPAAADVYVVAADRSDTDLADPGEASDDETTREPVESPAAEPESPAGPPPPPPSEPSDAPPSGEASPEPTSTEPSESSPSPAPSESDEPSPSESDDSPGPLPTVTPPGDGDDTSQQRADGDGTASPSPTADSPSQTTTNEEPT